MFWQYACLHNQTVDGLKIPLKVTHLYAERVMKYCGIIHCARTHAVAQRLLRARLGCHTKGLLPRLAFRNDRLMHRKISWI